jgi:membrane protease YdiL (CAAX protease family)
MPLVDIPQIWWYPIIYLPLFIAAIVVIRILGYNRRDIGLKWGKLPVQLSIGVVGFGLGFIEYLILKPEPLTTELTFQAAFLPALILIVTTGFVEELIFRGVLQRAAVKSFNKLGIVYVSSVFAVLHIGFLSIVDVAFVFVVALSFGWLVNKTGSLLGVTLAHGTTNIMLFIIAPFILG